MAGFAGPVNDPPRALATRAGLGDAENAAGADDLAPAAAGGADTASGAGFRAGAVAGLALVQFGDGDFLLAPVGGFLKGREWQLRADQKTGRLDETRTCETSGYE